ncbi:MAG: NADH-quinone oxidoreductase subunit N [Candidatus Omnitrophica bacterium]|nr:NADH-quinone oxidoreductase subunit N [Candidatus Omnitrophota bacterium]
MDLNWSLLSVELGLVALAVGCLLLDLWLPDDERRGRTMSAVALSGVLTLLAWHACRWGLFGTTFGGSYVLDGPAYFFKTIFLLSGAMALYLIRGYQPHLKRGHAEISLLVLFSQIGLSFLASANDLLLLFVSLEILTVSLYVMTAYLRDNASSIEAGVKYLVLGALSTAIFVFGASFVYGTTAATTFPAMAAALSSGVPPAFLFGMVLMVCSLGFKISMVPFQLWAPDIYQGAPTPVTGYLATASKAAGFAALLRLTLTVFAPAEQALASVFAVLAAVTILYGNLGAIPQTNIKRLLAYSSIGHAGYLLIGLATLSSTGKAAILYYLLSYLFGSAAVFLVIVAVCRNSDEISEFAGLSRRSPLLAAGMMLGLLSLAGVPPLGGFFGKFLVLFSAAESGLMWLVALGVVNVVVSLYYYLKVVKAMYLDDALDRSPMALSIGQRLMQWSALAGIFALGILQGPFTAFAVESLRSVLRS